MAKAAAADRARQDATRRSTALEKIVETYPEARPAARISCSLLVAAALRRTTRGRQLRSLRPSRADRDLAPCIRRRAGRVGAWQRHARTRDLIRRCWPLQPEASASLYLSGLDLRAAQVHVGRRRNRCERSSRKRLRTSARANALL